MEERQIEISTGRVALRLWGPEGGRPTLAIHGWLDNAASFDAIAPRMAHLRIAALDLPGHGRSSHRPAGCSYHFLDWIPDIIEVLRFLDWHSCSLLGHSLGGGIAAILAGTYPERFQKLVMIEAIGPMTAEASEMPERLSSYLKDRFDLGRRAPKVYQTEEEAIEQRLKAGTLTLESAKILASRGVERTPKGFYWSSDPRLRWTSPMRMTEAQVRAFLSRILCPTLVVRASQGLDEGRAHWEGRLRCLRNLKVEAVEGHHHVHLDFPDRVAPVIERFLTQNE